MVRGRAMDAAECLVKEYLLSLGQGLAVYEPDGNVPPDFLLDGRVAIEVRRLNQNLKTSNGDTEGIEKLSMSLWTNIKKQLLKFGPSLDGASWIVWITFGRPIRDLKGAKARIVHELSKFKALPLRQQSRITIDSNLQIEIVRCSHDSSRFFSFGGCSDNDAGGWVLGEVVENLKLCVAEKTAKIMPYRFRYEVWWLVLVDHIDFGVEAQDRALLRERLGYEFQNSWNKIILLDPRNHQRAYEL
jgi:hypothetical protein